MSRQYLLSEGTAAERRFPVYLVDATDGITPETGEAGGQPQISKAGGAWANTTATLTAIGNGTYYVELTATELNTLGMFNIRYKSANTAEFSMDGQVVAFDPNDTVRLGLTAMPNVASGSAGAIPTTGTGTAQIAVSGGAVTVGTNNDKTGYGLSGAAVQAIWDALTSALTTVGSIGKLIVDNLNATISSRMASYTQPTGFLGATFPTTVASTTNITAGTITNVDTVTNLTNAPTAGDLTATMKASINAEADTALTDAGVTGTRTGYLDKLNISGNVAGSAEVTSIQNNTRVVRIVPSVFERPDAGSTAFRIEVLLYDEVGNMEAPDSAPTISVVNEGGTSRDANLDSTTMSLVSTGRYRSTYTIDTVHSLEQLIFAFSIVEGGLTRVYGNTGLVVDTTAVDFTAADRTKLDTLHDTRLTAGRATLLDNLSNLDASVASRLPTASYTAPDNASITSILGDTSELQGDWVNGGRLDLLLDAVIAKTTNLPADPASQASVDASIAASEAAIRGADSDTIKTISDQIDGLTTSAGPQVLVDTTIATLSSQTVFTLTAGSSDNDAYNGAVAVITDQATATQKAVASILDYNGATKQITLADDPAIYTMAVGDSIAILANISSAPTAAAVRAEIDANSTKLAEIVQDTGTDIPSTLATIAQDTATDIPALLATIAGYIDTEITAIKAKTDLIPASPAATGDIPTAAAVAAEHFATVIENSVTYLQLLRRYNAILMGRISDAGSNPEHFRDLANTLDRVTIANDASGNRSSVTFNDS